MKKVNWFLDIIDIAIPLLLILCGDGNLGDYFVVYAWLVYSVFTFILKFFKK